MREIPVNRVRWSGAESIPEVESTLRRCGHVEIQLPPDYHHALYARIHPDSGFTPLEQLDVSDGIELLEKIASVRGLDEIRQLEPTVTENGAHVQVLSPVPLIILSLPTESLHA